MSNVAEPRSNVPPPTDEESISSPRTVAVGTAGRPRKPYVQKSRARSVFAESTGVGSTGPSEPAAKSAPDLISTTHPASTSAIVGCPSPLRAAATETHADSSPAIAGLVPSIGSTTSTHSAWPSGSTSPRSSE